MPQPCVSCGDPESRRYCPSCGEKQVSEEDRSLRRFLGEAVHTFTNLESSVFRTCGALVARPGHLTAEYLAGRRKRYIRPLQLFIICNLLFFVVQPYLGLDMLTTPLDTHLHHLYGSFARELVEARIEARGTSLETYAEEFNRTVALQARSLVIVMVPIFALFVYALYGGERRYFVEHLVFSLHFFAFFLLFFIAFIAILLASLHLLVSTGSSGAVLRLERSADDLSLVFALASFSWYLTSASRRAFGGSGVSNALKAATLAVLTIFVLMLYRMILFFTTFYTV
ncbi:MAG TPA: DUF3667 domain-containing protein [Longimicrobiaceae bacterium]|nr:DUF3667 domain-containing protein [Longimicrobiaceae bacterium]